MPTRFTSRTRRASPIVGEMPAACTSARIGPRDRTCSASSRTAEGSDTSHPIPVAPSTAGSRRSTATSVSTVPRRRSTHACPIPLLAPVITATAIVCSPSVGRPRVALAGQACRAASAAREVLGTGGDGTAEVAVGDDVRLVGQDRLDHTSGGLLRGGDRRGHVGLPADHHVEVVLADDRPAQVVGLGGLAGLQVPGDHPEGKITGHADAVVGQLKAERLGQAPHRELAGLVAPRRLAGSRTDEDVVNARPRAAACAAAGGRRARRGRRR